MKNFLSLSSNSEAKGLAVIRIIVGLLMIYHGWEIFSAAKMNEYAACDSFKGYSSPLIIVYIGKGAELLTGLLLTIGLYTRLAALFLIFTMLYIAFIVADGRIWSAIFWSTVVR